MRPQHVIAPWVVLGFLLVPAPGQGQGGSRPRAAEPLASLKVGHWVEIGGVIGADSTATCTKLKLLTGDFFDDDWAIRGTVGAVDAGRRELTVGVFRIHVTEATTYEVGKGASRGLAGLRPGAVVDVEGSYLKNREFLAAEVDDEGHERTRQPGSGGEVLLVGKIEGVDVGRRHIAVMGLIFHVTDTTRLRSVIH